MEEKIGRGELRRLEYWSEALGVGRRTFLEQFQARMFNRQETQVEKEGDGDGLHVLKEEPERYGSNGAKEPSKLELTSIAGPDFVATICR